MRTDDVESSYATECDVYDNVRFIELLKVEDTETIQKYLQAKKKTMRDDEMR